MMRITVEVRRGKGKRGKSSGVKDVVNSGWSKAGRDAGIAEK